MESMSLSRFVVFCGGEGPTPHPAGFAPGPHSRVRPEISPTADRSVQFGGSPAAHFGDEPAGPASAPRG